jgi:hypothetical protein
VEAAGEQRREQDTEDEDVRLTQYQAAHRSLQLDRERTLFSDYVENIVEVQNSRH